MKKNLITMDEPAKPFACTMLDCGMSFTNEDHLHVHTKKHDMVLQLGIEQKAAFVADQTPTPTRFIRNCEEVGLFQDLQNVAANPFDEGFKRAMESKPGLLSLEATVTPPDDSLHTPHFPLLDTAEGTLFINNQRNVTISRSSSDESGAIKEFETRTISKLTNEVTTISRYATDDVTFKQTETQKDIQTVSYKNNVITIESNVIRKDDTTVPILIYTDKKTADHENKQNSHINITPIMSQKSIDSVVDKLTSELQQNTSEERSTNIKNNVNQTRPKKIVEVLKKEHAKRNNIVNLPQILPNHKTVIKSEIEEFEVYIKLPNGKSVRMTPAQEIKDSKNEPHLLKAKEVIRNKIVNKINSDKKEVKKSEVNSLKISSGTLIPVTLVNTEGAPLSNDDLSKMPITKLNNVEDIDHLRAESKIVGVTPIVITTNIEKDVIVNLPCNFDEKVPKNSVNTNSVNKPVVLVGQDGGSNKMAEQQPLESRSIEFCDTDTVNDRPGRGKRSRIVLVGQDGGSNKMAEQQPLESRSIEFCDTDTVNDRPGRGKRSRMELESRSAASKRYRERLKHVMRAQDEENKLLRQMNTRLIAEKAMLKLLITQHVKKCPNGAEITERLNILMNENDI